jgi:replicative DNA helicase
MVTSYSNTVEIKDMQSALVEAVQYIDDRRTGTVTPLKTRWPKLNAALNGGIEPNCIYTIAGASGCGKSAFLGELTIDLIERNPSQEIVILALSFEMHITRIIGRYFSNKLRKTTRALYSAEYKLSDSEMSEVQEKAREMVKYPIYYLDTPTSVDGVRKIVEYFLNTVAKDKWLIVMLDHTLLVDGDEERGTIVQLQKLFLREKKIGKTTFIQLSQLNGKEEEPARVMNLSGHYPLKSDLFASGSVYHASDAVIILSRPEMRHLTEYGPNRLPVEDRIYAHIIKNRDGTPGIIAYMNNLQYQDFIEL